MVRGFSRAATIIVLPLAIWATLPTVQWCPLPWGQLRPGCFVECVASEHAPGQRCMAGAGDEASARGRCDDPATCEMGGRAAGSGCPLEDAASRDTRDARAGQRHAFCLGGPNGGTGLHTDSPQLGPAPVAVLAGSVELERPAPSALRFVAIARARPPTESGSRLPPSRAPPLAV